MRLTRILAAVTLVAAGLTANIADAQTTLRIGLAEDPDILDPTLARTFVGRIVFAAMCDKLVDISADLKIVPQLATEWHWVDDNKGLVMTLRQGVKFQDGEKMDAAAVKFSIERHLTMPGSNRKAEISAVKSVEIVDDHTVKLVLDKPFAPLLAQLSDRAGMIVSPKAAQAEGDKFGDHPVCAGPYKFTERVAQDRIVLDRFPDYWNKDAVHFDRIVYLPVPDATVRLANLQSGQFDLIERLAATDLDAASKDSRLKIATITSLAYEGITINLNNGERAKHPLGQDKRVREALELSIDRNALNQVVFNGQFTPGNQWEAPSSPWYVKSIPIPARDVAKAKSLLAAAGVPHPSFTLMVPNNTEATNESQVIQSMAAEAGFDIKLQSTEFASSLDLASKGDFEAYQIGWSGRTDPDGNIYNFVGCKAPPALNAAKYCNPEVDAALDAARAASTDDARMAQYTIVAQHILADRPIIYLYHRRWLYAMNAGLSGFTPYPDGLIRPQGIEMK
ncbi:MAG TPA: ABC transporter substrate-binding protein [Stellaceae bacterium]|nr:ABC transporter substrate-binding protein [Stellaceae bacterium]